MGGDRSRVRRWIVLGKDGRHITLGRHSNPAEDEIAEVETALAARGMAGWLVIAEGDYWSRRGRMHLLEVRPLADPAGDFDEAVAAFEAVRKAGLASL